MFQLGIEFVIELDLGSDAPLVGRLVDAVLRSGWVRMEANLVEFRIGLKHAPHIHIGNMLAVSAELVDNFRDPVALYSARMSFTRVFDGMMSGYIPFLVGVTCATMTSVVSGIFS